MGGTRKDLEHVLPWLRPVRRERCGRCPRTEWPNTDYGNNRAVVMYCWVFLSFRVDKQTMVALDCGQGTHWDVVSMVQLTWIVALRWSACFVSINTLPVSLP